MWQRVTQREVAPGLTVLLVPVPLAAVFAFGSYSGGLLPWLHTRFPLSWFGVAALATTAFATAYAASEQPPPIALNERRPPVLRNLGGARVLALSLLCLSISFFKSLSGFMTDPAGARLGAAVTWWGIPVALCFWVLAAVAFARETEQAGTGVPAAPQRRWGWLVFLRSSRLVRVSAYAILFSGTVAFVVLGSIPGLIWTTTEGAPGWQGPITEPASICLLAFFFWAAALGATAWVYLAHAFRTRPAALPYAELRRSWYAVWAAGALVIVIGLFGLATQGWLAEPLLELVLALYALVFVLMIVDASAATRRRRVKSSLARRAIAASGTIGFAVAVPMILGLPPLRAGLIAGLVAGAIPLAPTAFRALYGIERLPRTVANEAKVKENDLIVEPLLPSPEQQQALASILVKGQG